jgi:hypothetical protein
MRLILFLILWTACLDLLAGEDKLSEISLLNDKSNILFVYDKRPKLIDSIRMVKEYSYAFSTHLEKVQNFYKVIATEKIVEFKRQSHFYQETFQNSKPYINRSFDAINTEVEGTIAQAHSLALSFNSSPFLEFCASKECFQHFILFTSQVISELERWVKFSFLLEHADGRIYESSLLRATQDSLKRIRYNRDAILDIAEKGFYTTQCHNVLLLPQSYSIEKCKNFLGLLESDSDLYHFALYFRLQLLMNPVSIKHDLHWRKVLEDATQNYGGRMPSKKNMAAIKPFLIGLYLSSQVSSLGALKFDPSFDVTDLYTRLVLVSTFSREQLNLTFERLTTIPL